LSPRLFQSILSAAKPSCSLLILFCAPKRSVQWSAVPNFGLICFPPVVVPALSVAAAYAHSGIVLESLDQKTQIFLMLL
jgi:hypothetical protein